MYLSNGPTITSVASGGDEAIQCSNGAKAEETGKRGDVGAHKKRKNGPGKNTLKFDL